MALTKVSRGLLSTGIVDNSNATAITIDSSENVLVGKTALEYDSNAGHIFRSDGFQSSIRSGGNVADFNRLSSDGEIIRLSKDGTTVGSIGSSGGDLVIGTGITGIHFHDGVDSLIPWNVSTASYRDAAIALGTSSYRYTDIYLSGGVNFSANAHASGMTSETLSDYEEGTCTLTWSGSGGTADSTNTEFKYVKVGTLVSINGHTATNLPNATGTLELTGLPFPSVGSAAGSILYRNLTAPSGAHTLICFLGNGSSRFQPFWAAQGTYVQLNSSHINSNNAQDMYLSINYRTS